MLGKCAYLSALCELSLAQVVIVHDFVLSTAITRSSSVGTPSDQKPYPRGATCSGSAEVNKCTCNRTHVILQSDGWRDFMVD